MPFMNLCLILIDFSNMNKPYYENISSHKNNRRINRLFHYSLRALLKVQTKTTIYKQR